jgi:hypothetical protein
LASFFGLHYACRVRERRVIHAPSVQMIHGEESMDQISTLSLTTIALLLAGALSATDAVTQTQEKQHVSAQDATQPVVPMEKAPFHVPTFRNEYVTMLNIYIPAGRQTASYHKHSIDYVFVSVDAAKYTAQELGKEVLEPKFPAGTVLFGDYTKKPVVHRVSNIDTKPLHTVGFEIMFPEPGRFFPSTRSEVPAYKPVLDNERVRGWRLVLEPGESVAAITQKAPGVRIVLSGGELVESEPGRIGQDMILKQGDFMWQEPGATRTVHNTGITRIEFVEFELK